MSTMFLRFYFLGIIVTLVHIAPPCSCRLPKFSLTTYHMFCRLKMANTSEIMQVNTDGRLRKLTSTRSSSKSPRPKKRGQYFGDSERTKRRRLQVQKETAFQKCLQSVPSLHTYFNKSSTNSTVTRKRPSRSCTSLYTTSNNAKRRVSLEVAEKRRKAIWARAPNNNKQRRASTKTRGACKKRRSCLGRKTKKAQRSSTARKTLQDKPTKSYLVVTMKTKLTTLEKTIRSGRRCNIVLSPLLRTMYKIILVCLHVCAYTSTLKLLLTHAPTTRLQVCLQNTFETAQGHATISITQAGWWIVCMLCYECLFV